jgi:2-polyprenyl-3-methyl-5-hydroxy-6-metoxy-1,4-benzoquinol methylase
VKFAVTVVSPEGYAHSEAFREVGETIHHGLVELGHDSILTNEFGSIERRHIVLGANLLPRCKVDPPAGSILYNLEQISVGSPWLKPELLELFRHFEVWDYSRHNVVELAKLGITNVRLLPIGSVPQLTRIAKAAEDIDVLFYGSINPRRQVILDALVSRGVKVKTLFGVYGAARDAVIARSRIVLNLHFYETKVFEAVRVSYLLANRRVVVAERGAVPEEEAAFERGVAFADYGELVDTCLSVLKNPEERQRLSVAGHQIMTTRQESEFLASALNGGLPPHGSTSHAPQVPTYYNFSRPEVVARIAAKGAKVLEVGCAAGAMGAALLEKGAALVVGLELDAKAAAVARSRLTAVYQVNLDDLPLLPYPDGFFDVITCADVLEHLVDPLAVLKHLRRYLDDQGTIVASIPNIRHESVLLPLLVDGRFQYQDAGILDRTHLRFFTATELEQHFREAGFAIKDPVDANGSAPTKTLGQLAAAVASLGGDAERFLSEACVIQYLFDATPTQPIAQLGLTPSTTSGTNQWEGSKSIRVLLTPDVGNAADTWQTTASDLLRDLGAKTDVTVALAIPAALLESPPVAFHELAKSAQCDLLLTELPQSGPALERLFAGATMYVHTSSRPDLSAVARKVGLEQRSGASGNAQPHVESSGRGEALYLDLMKRALTNTIYEDAQLKGEKNFEPKKRDVGMDWPSSAHTMVGRKRLDQLQECIEAVLKDGVAGDFLEAGVWRGGATIFMRAVLKAHDVTNRRVFVADSFEGLPAPDPARYPADKDDSHHTQKDLAVSMEQVQANFSKYGLLDEQVIFLRGWFKDTLPNAPLTSLAVARLDGDMYESTIDAISALYPKLSVGGFLIVDDFGAVAACRKAIDDYRKAKGITETIVPIDWTGVFWRKLR